MRRGRSLLPPRPEKRPPPEGTIGWSCEGDLVTKFPFRSLAVVLALVFSTHRSGAESLHFEHLYLRDLFQLHFGAALKATGHPWPDDLWDHRFHVVSHDEGEWAVFADLQALHKPFFTWSLAFHEQDGWKMLPYSIAGIELTGRSVTANRDRFVHRLHLEALPTRIVDDMLKLDQFMAFPENPDKPDR
jgi:hypothetical protein